eukprot:scaffold2886_cov398-Prasinococcus_capsulatus_cf.AAC.3
MLTAFVLPVNNTTLLVMAWRRSGNLFGALLLGSCRVVFLVNTTLAAFAVHQFLGGWIDIQSCRPFSGDLIALRWGLRCGEPRTSLCLWSLGHARWVYGYSVLLRLRTWGCYVAMASQPSARLDVTSLVEGVSAGLRDTDCRRASFCQHRCVRGSSMSGLRDDRRKSQRYTEILRLQR